MINNDVADWFKSRRSLCENSHNSNKNYKIVTNLNSSLSKSKDRVWEINNKLAVLSIDGVSMSVCLTKTTFLTDSGFIDENEMIVLQLLVKKTYLKSCDNSKAFRSYSPCESSFSETPFIVYQRQHKKDPRSRSFHSLDEAVNFYEKIFKQEINYNWPKQGLKYGWQTQIPKKYKFYNNCLIMNARQHTKFDFQSVTSHIQELLKALNGIPTKSFESAPAEYRSFWACLPEEQILEARKTLFDILKSLRDGETQNLPDFNSKFYTLLPCSMFNKNSRFIDNYTMLGNEFNRLDYIEGIKNDFPSCLRYIEKETEIYKQIKNAILTTHGPNHRFEVQLDKVYSFNDDKSLASNKKTLLLWHGTLKSCVPGILRRGFGVPTTSGQLHGKAVYFTPCTSKASKYCNVAKGSGIIKTRVGVLLLCEVGVDDAEVQMVRPRYYNPFRDDQIRTVHSVGRYQASGQVLVDGTNMKVGPMMDVNKQDNYLVNFDEYAIYDASKVKVRFVVLIKIGTEVRRFPGR